MTTFGTMMPRSRPASMPARSRSSPENACNGHRRLLEIRLDARRRDDDLLERGPRRRAILRIEAAGQQREREKRQNRPPSKWVVIARHCSSNRSRLARAPTTWLWQLDRREALHEPQVLLGSAHGIREARPVECRRETADPAQRSHRGQVLACHRHRWSRTTLPSKSVATSRKGPPSLRGRRKQYNKSVDANAHALFSTPSARVDSPSADSSTPRSRSRIHSPSGDQASSQLRSFRVDEQGLGLRQTRSRHLKRTQSAV